MERLKNGFLIWIQDVKNWYRGVLAALIYILIADLLFGNMCPMVLVFGYPCPACGLTRAGLSLLAFHPDVALLFNPMIYPIAAVMIYAVGCRYIMQCKCRGIIPMIVMISIGLMVLYCYRMKYQFPSNPPMVYNSRNLIAYLKKR